MNLQNELATKVKEIADFILNDIKAFQYLKSEHQMSYENATNKHGVGGGNYLQTLGALSVFYFLVKMNHMIRFESLEELKCALLQLVDYSLRVEKKGTNIKSLYELAGISWDVDYQDLYKNYRNYLSHVSVPKGIINADCIFLSHNDYEKSKEELEKSTGKVFETKEKRITSINADLLYRDVQKMRVTLVKEIRKIEDRNNEIEIVAKILDKLFV